VSVHTCPITNCQSTDPDGNRQLITTPLCQHHKNRLAHTLENAPRTYAELSTTMAPAQGSAAGDKVSSGETIRLPINTNARALQQDLLGIITTAETALRHTNQWAPAPDRGREGPTLTAAAQVVHAHLEQLLTIQHGLVFAIDLLDNRRQTDRLLGHSNPPVRLHAPCPACGCLSLERTPGQDTVACVACGQQLDQPSYHAHTHALAEEYAA
jgi:hypothetical protein